MSRRATLLGAAAVAGIPTIGTAAASPGSPPGPPETSLGSKTFSTSGSDRATGYESSTKIVSYDGKTHVAWLDYSAEDGHLARVASQHHDPQDEPESGRWSDVHTLGPAADNHGDPALTVDSSGHLHAVYGPHHHPMRYRRSTAPNDASAWDEEVQFGENLTYPSIVCGSDDTLYLTARKSTDQWSDPWKLAFFSKEPGEDWVEHDPVFELDGLGYHRMKHCLAIDPDTDRLHLNCDLGAIADDAEAHYVYSDDGGETWRSADGTPFSTPGSKADATEIAPGDDGGWQVAGNITLAPDGTPYVVTSPRLRDARVAQLAYLDESTGTWTVQTELAQYLPEQYREGWDFHDIAGASFTDDGEVYVAAAVSPRPRSFSDPANEVVLLCSTDGGDTFTGRAISEENPDVARWLPSIERPGVHSSIGRAPSLLYTVGNDQDDEGWDEGDHEVEWVRTDMD